MATYKIKFLDHPDDPDYGFANQYVLNVGTGRLEGTPVNNLVPDANGQPVSFNVALSHGPKQYTFNFSGGPTNGRVTISWPDGEAGNASDSWDAVAGTGPADS